MSRWSRIIWALLLSVYRSCHLRSSLLRKIWRRNKLLSLKLGIRLGSHLRWMRLSGHRWLRLSSHWWLLMVTLRLHSSHERNSSLNLRELVGTNLWGLIWSFANSAEEICDLIWQFSKHFCCKFRRTSLLELSERYELNNVSCSQQTFGASQNCTVSIKDVHLREISASYSNDNDAQW